MNRPEIPGSNPKGLSSLLWQGVPTDMIFGFGDRGVGIGLFDDFVGFGKTTAAASNVERYASNGITYIGWGDDTAVETVPSVPTTTPSVDANGPSVIQLQTHTTDNDSTSIMAGGGTMCPFNVIQASAGLLVFETRIKYSSIAGGTDFFIGLGGTGACANDGCRADNSGVLASNNFLGFTRLATGTSSLTFTYQRVGGTEATHTGMHTMVADTWFKAGFRFDPTTKQCTVWIDGEKVHTVTRTETGATPWPTLYMNFLAEVKYQSTAADILFCDWWACAQMQ